MPTLTQALRKEYTDLFNTCQVNPARRAEVDAVVSTMIQNKARYQAISKASGVPWFFIAIIHNLESGMDFKGHLHNGDPLTARTVQVPAGRPKTGNPPFTFEVSALDALAQKKLGADTDWSLSGILYRLEGYNGYGYRNQSPPINTPYLWSFSNHYTKGKYVADGKYSPTAVSKQCGAAVVLRRLAEMGHATFPDQPAPAKPLVRWAKAKPTDAQVLEDAMDLQRWLNARLGIFLRVDGWAGDRTSDAFKLVFGKFLPGDPRG